MSRSDDDLKLTQEWNDHARGRDADPIDEPDPTDHPLSPQLRDVAGKLGRIRTDIQRMAGDIRKSGEMLARGFEALQDAIYDNIQAQAELKIMEYVAEAESVEDQIDAEHKQIEREKSELEGKLQNIRERYEQRYRELDETAEERVRNIGEHIFEIMEDEFEAAIERPFVEHVTGAWEDLRRHNLDVKDERSDTLRTGLSEVHGTVDTFLEGRETLLERIEDHRLDLESPPEDVRSVQVPYWVVTVETSEGTRRELVAPSRLRSGEGEWFTGRLDPIDGFEPTVERAAENTELRKPRRRKVSSTGIAESLEPYSDDALGGQVTFADGVAEAVGEEGVTVEVEGGETDG